MSFGAVIGSVVAFAGTAGGAAAIGGGLGVAGSLLNAKGAKDAAAASNEQQQRNREVDYNITSKEGKDTLLSLFGPASGLATRALGTDYGQMRNDIIQGGMQSAITTAVNADIPKLKATMGKAGAYNSTSYGIVGNDIIASAAAKGYLGGSAAADSAIQTQLAQINPILALLGIDKGAQKKGIESSGAAGAVAAGPDYRSVLKDGATLIGGITGLFGGQGGGTAGSNPNWAPGE